MPNTTKRQGLAGRNLASYRARGTLPSASAEENEAPETPLEDLTKKPKAKRQSLRDQLAEKEAQLDESEAQISQLSSDLAHLQTAFESLSRDYETLLERKNDLVATNRSLNTLKRKADTSAREELTRRRKRIKRLETLNITAKKSHVTALHDQQTTAATHLARIAVLENSLKLADDRIHSHDAIVDSLRSVIQEKQTALTTTRNRLYATQKKAERAQSSLKELRRAHRELEEWDPMEGNEYKAAARKLGRDLTQTGCAAGKVEFAVRACAEAFGIRIRRRFMSRRTVGRVIDEGGTFSELQLAREILNAPGFVESSDGTSYRGINVEGRHITLPVPSYAPDIDDSDQSTWTHRTRFWEVAPALDHTAKRQFEGTREAATRTSELHSNSPFAEQEGRTMDSDEYWRKKLGEGRDHAADGKRAFAYSDEHKTDVVIRDLGRSAMEDPELLTGEILLTMSKLSNEDLQNAGNITADELASLPTEKRSELLGKALEKELGQDRFSALTSEEQSNLTTHFFGGCCMHKDSNVLKHGYVAVQRLYKTHNIPPPVLLPNKANGATIALGDDSDSAAVKNAVDDSSAGAIKLLQLMGALFRHKDRIRGYQDRSALFLRKEKEEMFGIKEAGKFPDVSNTRYGCYTWAAVEVVCYPQVFQGLVEDAISSKTKAGAANNVEKNILLALDCKATMTELVALALYGVSVSWPYMAQVRGKSGEMVNLLSLTPLHRKLPTFCAHIAANPLIFFDSSTPQDQLTIDGKPFLNDRLLDAISIIKSDLPNLALVISTLFSGCDGGWVHFTPEFHVGGTIDRLTPWQRQHMWVPATNDANEGILGSYTDNANHRPNSTARYFTNRERVPRNNTEAFIRKCCDAAVRKFVMRQVRKDGANGANAKFRKALAALQQEKAESGRMRLEKAVAKKIAKAARLAATQLEFDITKINSMTSAQLKEQLAVYRDQLKDPVLLKILWKNMNTVALRRKFVLEARDREMLRRTSTTASDTTEMNEEPLTVDEFGFGADEDAEWEDVVE